MITILNIFGDAWLGYFSLMALQNTIFLIVIYVVLYLLRRASARIRYSVAALGILKLLLPPFLPITLPQAPATSAAPLMMSVESMPGPVEAVTPHLSAVSVIFTLWAVTALLVIFSALTATFRLKWRLRRAVHLDRLSVDGYSFDLRQSDAVTVPMSIGIRPKRIYVPDTWALLTPGQQSVMLRHEVAHINRWDGLFSSLQLLAQAIYFFHPLVWLLNERINEYREMACDDLAVEQSNVTPLAYSRYLVHVAENMLPVWSCSTASALIKQRNKLYHRVNYLVKENTTMKTLSKNKRRLLVVAALLSMTLLSWYSSSAVPNPGDLAEYDTPPQLIGGVKAIQQNLVYPEKAKQAGVQGKVILNATVDQKGRIKVVSLEVDAEAEKYFSEAAVAALEATEWQPALLKGKPVDAIVKIPIEFKLDGKKEEFAVAPPSPADSFLGAYDTPPEPVGGFAAIQANLVYPQAARQAGIEGRVYINIMIDEGGNVVDTKVLQSLGDSGCDEAAISAIKATQWTPAKQKGKPVKVWVGIPVVFKLSDGQKAESPAPPLPSLDALPTIPADHEKSSSKRHDDNEASADSPISFAHDQGAEPVGGLAAIQEKLVYPQAARQAGIEGRVYVNVLIDESGSVVDTKVFHSFGDNACDEAAMAAIKAVQWKPAKQMGKPVKFSVGVPVVFKLKESDPPISGAYDQPPEPIGGFAAIQSKVAYPEVAHKAGVEGRVYINVLIDEGGKVLDTKVLRSLGDNGCDEAAIAAIKAVQWMPAQKQGKPVKVWVGIPIVFKLKE